MAKKKKRHAGLKFLAFVAVVVGMIFGIKTGSHTEVGQRVLGHREDRRTAANTLTPRFAFASAQVRITRMSIFNPDGTTVDVTSTRNVSIDRQSSSAASDVSIDRTATEIAPGVDAIPYDSLNTKWNEVLTKDFYYESDVDGHPWVRSPNPPYYYATEIDDHYIPMIDDIVGFELRDLPPKPEAAATPAAGLKSSVARPSVDSATTPADLTTTTYEMDMETFRRAVPILDRRTMIDAPPDTTVTLTIGFDDVGLLRYADVSIPSTVATELAQALGAQHSALYHYTFEVTEISGEPVKIDVPTDYVDQPVATDPPVAAP